MQKGFPLAAGRCARVEKLSPGTSVIEENDPAGKWRSRFAGIHRRFHAQDHRVHYARYGGGCKHGDNAMFAVLNQTKRCGILSLTHPQEVRDAET